MFQGYYARSRLSIIYKFCEKLNADFWANCLIFDCELALQSKELLRHFHKQTKYVTFAQF